LEHLARPAHHLDDGQADVQERPASLLI
jgi:hypothetical protein